MARPVRIRVAGIYTENESILLVKHRKFGKEYFLLPGGGQETGETAEEALRREWQEELNIDIQPGKFLFYGESVPKDLEKHKHVVQIVFEVTGYTGQLKLSPDDTLVGVEWIPISDLDKITLYPRCMEQLSSWLQNQKPDTYTVYNWEN